jgi:enoyl-[acyl-carrier-protein] reductase (NADH)
MLRNNYAAILKKGKKQRWKMKTIEEITPVATNARTKQSQFVKGIDAMPSNAQQTYFINFSKDDYKKTKYWSCYCFICFPIQTIKFSI